MRGRRAMGHVALPLRKLSMLAEEWRTVHSDTPLARLFNLDLHISVIADIRAGLDSERELLQTWSVSGANAVMRRVYSEPDPVDVVNARTWKGLDPAMIEAFQHRYARFLIRFDGFISTYPPSFSQLFGGLDRPQLVVAATRYEAPYTNQPRQWRAFDAFLAREIESKRLVLAANNRGDRDYIKVHTGLEPVLAPSLCDYTGMRWRPGGDRRIIFTKSRRLAHDLERMSGGRWRSSTSHFPHGYQWRDIERAAEVFVVPYNVSTMTLFELATAGIPVAVPSRDLLVSWAQGGEHGALTELTFSQVAGQPPVRRDAIHDPMHPDFFHWWLDRADFYDRALMPNVREVGSLQELVEEPHPWALRSTGSLELAVEMRNDRIRASRAELIDRFRSLL